MLYIYKLKVKSFGVINPSLHEFLCCGKKKINGQFELYTMKEE